MLFFKFLFLFFYYFPAGASQIMQLVNRIIYANIYSDPEECNAETPQQPEASQGLREGVLLLHRGGLASFRWVKYGCVFVIVTLL